jgi:pimeloyl-ACP methyl ester carboxylesterase
VDRLPIIYVRGYAGPSAGIDSQVDDPFYGFNKGATHVRVGGDGDPMFYQFEGPMLRLITDENYRLLVRGDQAMFLNDAQPGAVPQASLWVYRFYDQAATTFVAPPQEGLVHRVFSHLHAQVSAKGFDIEVAAKGLYDLIMNVREKTGADKVHLVAHSMGGLVVRSMMAKFCSQDGRKSAKEIVSKFFTYGTPHGGITFEVGALDWAEQAFGPAGSDIFAPAKMYGYLTPGKQFGDVPGKGANWDPQRIDPAVFNHDDIFCIVGTDPKDYGSSRVVVGPKSDGLVRIEHAYVRGAHRAYLYKSHSGSYGEVNSEEGYQNLRRFLFGRWAVNVSLGGLQPFAADWPVWQADMRLAIRGVSVVMSEQDAAHWCPIQIKEELKPKKPDDPPITSVTLVSTFLLDPAHEAQIAKERGDAASPVRHGGRLRYVLSLRLLKLVEKGGVFDFKDHLEQVPVWADSLIVDVGPNADRTGLEAWAAWNSEVGGVNDELDPITENLKDGRNKPIAFENANGVRSCSIDLPPAAKTIKPLVPDSAHIVVTVTDRGPES